MKPIRTNLLFDEGLIFYSTRRRSSTEQLEELMKFVRIIAQERPTRI